MSRVIGPRPNRSTHADGGAKARREYREGVEGKTLAFATAALGRLVATSLHLRVAVAHRSRLFDALVFALNPRVSSGGGGANGSSTSEEAARNGSPPLAVSCSAFCLAHIATSASASLLTRDKILAAAATLARLLDVRLNKLDRILKYGEVTSNEDRVRPSIGPDQPGTLHTDIVVSYAGAALWGCLSRFRGKYPSTPGTLSWYARHISSVNWIKPQR